MPAPVGDLLDTPQAAALLGVHEVTLIIWRRQKRGPRWLAPDDARIILYRRADIDSWLAGNPVKPESDGLRMMRMRAKGGTAERVEYETAKRGIDGISNEDVAEGVRNERKATGGERGRRK